MALLLANVQKKVSRMGTFGPQMPPHLGRKCSEKYCFHAFLVRFSCTECTTECSKTRLYLLRSNSPSLRNSRFHTICPALRSGTTRLVPDRSTSSIALPLLLVHLRSNPGLFKLILLPVGAIPLRTLSESSTLCCYQRGLSPRCKRQRLAVVCSRLFLN